MFSFWIAQLVSNANVSLIYLDFEYSELGAFQKYLINEDNFGSLGYLCDKLKCPDIQKMDDCGGASRHFCKTNRICKHRLIGCENIHKDNRDGTVACVNVSK